MNKWIDCESYGDEITIIGGIGFLVESHDNNHGGSVSRSLYGSPLRTNQSREPRLFGWCGETNNVSKFARGVWRVSRINKAGDRMQIVKIIGDDRDAWLEKNGWGELVPAAA